MATEKIKGDIMQIEISKKEYRSLIDMIQIASWVLNAHKIEKDSSLKKYDDIKQKIYSLASEMGCEELILYDEKLKAYFPTRKFDEGQGMGYIDEYDNDTFWDELADRLVIRDVMRKVGEEKYKRLKLEKRFEAEEPIREMYNIEFEENGLDNIKILLYPSVDGII